MFGKWNKSLRSLTNKTRCDMIQYLMGNYTRLTIRSVKRLPPRVISTGSVTSGARRPPMMNNHTPILSEEQDTYVSRSIKELQTALQEIAELKLRLQEAKDTLPQRVVDCLLAAPTRDEADALAWEVYWRLQDIPTTPLSDFYRMPIAHVREIIGTATANVGCRTCGKPQRQVFNSRSAFKDAIGDGWRAFECDDCKAKKNQETEEWKRKYELAKEQRASELQALKTMPYRDYLQTEHWKTVRMDMLKRAKYSCQLCSAKGVLHVHHKTYERKGEENYSDLIVLCANCHAKFHDKLEGAS